VGSDAGDSFLAAFALFELGEDEAALELFLYGALNYPRAARMLAGDKVRRAPTVTSAEEADDHNTRVSLLRALHAFFRLRFGYSKAARDRVRDVQRDVHHFQSRIIANSTSSGVGSSLIAHSPQDQREREQPPV